MHSNFITPPDFVDDDLHTVTVVDATVDEVELLANMCKVSPNVYNIYLYRTEMNELTWLDQSIARSAAVIVGNTVAELDFLYKLANTYYYGDVTYLTPATKVNSVLDYFGLQNQTK
jgi:hypothetical protein